MPRPILRRTVKNKLYKLIKGSWHFQRESFYLVPEVVYEFVESWPVLAQKPVRSVRQLDPLEVDRIHDETWPVV